MRIKSKGIVLLTAALLSCVLVGYLMLRDIPGVNNPPGEKKQYSIEVVVKSLNNSPVFWGVVEQGIRMGAEEFLVDCNVSGPANENDIDDQIQLVREAIARQPDALILAAGHYSRLAPLCEEAAQAGILVVMLDSDADTDQKICFVGTDNYELGKKLASLVDELILPGERFGVVGHVETTTTAIERSRGLLENVYNADERLADLAYCDGIMETARLQTIEMLAQHPDIRCMVGLNESSALGIANALVELGVAGEVKLVVCDNSEQQIHYMETGAIQAFVIQNPFNMGYLSMQAAVNALNGKHVDPVINTGSIIITREDMNRPENQKLLFPFTN